MLDADQDIKLSTQSILTPSIEQQIRKLEQSRDEHTRLINEKITKLKLQAELSLNSVNSVNQYNLSTPEKNSSSLSTRHRKSLSMTSKPEKIKNLSMKSFKLVVAGDKATGKTTLERTFNVMHGQGTKRFSQTMKNEYNRVNVNLSVIPTKGNVALRNSYFFRAKGIIYLFDLTNQSSLYNFDVVVQEAKKEIKSKIWIFLVGTRADMIGKYSRGIEKEEAQNLALNYGALYFEVNLNEEEDVRELFREIFKVLGQDN